jgi:TolB-like protein/AraC-like DNA-binding protein
MQIVIEKAKLTLFACPEQFRPGLTCGQKRSRFFGSIYIIETRAMPDSTLPGSDFLADLTSVIEKNISNEQFGVSELADEMSMSRSNLLRKVKKETKLSVSQLISQVRLKRAMELLRKTSHNVSEVSAQVGFNSTSYFIKCFREYYGYPPGEVGKRDAMAPLESGILPESTQEPGEEERPKKKPVLVYTLIALLVITAIGYFFGPGTMSVGGGEQEEKSIAVLPFKNDSNDSTNLYLINGLMEATLSKLQKIQDLRVISRTSVEKYRNTSKSIPEMAKELNVKYFVEGSGQKMGDKILLNIQLIDAATDKHLWAKQYRRESKDIFELQEEIAKNITQEIEVFITPEEEDLIKKKPTEDLVAYDYFLKGKELFYRSGPNDLKESIPWFKKAVDKDPKFSLAYATAAMVYYYLDLFSLEKKYTADIDNYAEKAIIYDARSSESMVAKALSFAQKAEYELSIPYLEKALEYDPRSGLVLHFLTEFYNIHVPNPPKYLEYAIRKVKVDKATDSTTASFNYFTLSAALLQTGFLDEALKYNEKSQKLNPKGYFTGYVHDYILYAKDRDALKAKARLLARWKKDTTRFDILQEVGKVSFIARDYAGAKSCYDRALPVMKMYGMDIFKHEYLRIGMAYEIAGEKEKAEEFIRIYKDYAERNRTIYKDLHLSAYYAYKGDTDKAIAIFKRFSEEQDSYLFWLLLIPSDPVLDNLKKHPEFDGIMKKIERKYWKQHEELKEKWGEEIADI